ncbi:MAG: UDP-glucose 4-epimerase [Myxococcota bacterium]|jgi:UDP-glucose 4-epimerase
MGGILITGIAGSLARLTALAFQARGEEVIGVDYRPKPALHPPSIPFYQGNYNKTRFEDVVRKHRPDGIVHLGRVGNLKVRMGKRFDLNVVGSAKVQELALKYGIDRLLVLSTFHIYGAHPHNHIPIFEDEPLRAGTTFPQIADAVQLDNMASRWCYQHRELRTIVIRPTNVIGPDIHNAVSRYLRSARLSYILGFSPMWQFVHQTDLVDALVTGYDSNEIGVFNVAGAGTIPILEALELTLKPTLPIPSVVATAMLKLQAALRPTLPSYLVDFFKYPCVISDEKFRKAVGYVPSVGIADSIRSTVR